MENIQGTPIFAHNNDFKFNFDEESLKNKKSKENQAHFSKREFSKDIQVNDNIILQLDKKKLIDNLKKIHSIQLYYIKNSDINIKKLLESIINELEAFSILLTNSNSFEIGKSVFEKMKLIIYSHLKYLNWDKSLDNIEYNIITKRFVNQMIKDVENLIGKKSFLEQEIEDIWEYTVNTLKKVSLEKKKLQDSMEEAKLKVKDLKKQLESLSEVLSLTNMPATPKKL